MESFIIGIIVGIAITIGFWMINRWYWREMYKSEVAYSKALRALFEQNHPFKVVNRSKEGSE